MYFAVKVTGYSDAILANYVYITGRIFNTKLSSHGTSIESDRIGYLRVLLSIWDGTSSVTIS